MQHSYTFLIQGVDCKIPSSWIFMILLFSSWLSNTSFDKNYGCTGYLAFFDIRYPLAMSFYHVPDF